MRQLQVAFLTLLWITGTVSTACASAQDNPPPPAPPFGEPPDPPPPPRRDGPERKERIQRLETQIRELEAALKSDEGTDERRAELKKRLVGMRNELHELRGDGPPRQDDNPRLREKMARQEQRIQELERALQNKDAAPEQRRKWEAELDQARADMKDLHAAMRPQEKDKRPQDPGGMDRLHARLREIEGLLGKVGPEDRKELMAEAEKIRAEIGRRGGPQGFGQPGMPPDPELQKLHMEAMELERASMDLAQKLRGIPKDKEGDRSPVLDKLKDVVTKLFDVREKSRVREVELIKKRLEELTQMLEKRKENRDAIIEKRIKQLSGESDPLDW